MAMPGIVIQIGADTASAIAGINKVEKALGRSLTPVEKLGRVTDKVLVPALAAAGVAAAAFAVKIGVDGVNAALADEKAMALLAGTLDNVNQGWKTQDVETFIDGMARATGVADDELRPAFQSLVTVTKDVVAAEDLLTIAMDAAATGTVSLESATTALSKAAGGNTTSLGKMFPALDKSRLATEGLTYASEELTRLYGGQAATAANTYQGKLDRLSVAAGEATEVIGYALLGAMDDVSEAMGGPNGAADAADVLATEFSYLITGAGKVASGIARITKAALDAIPATQGQADETASLWGALSALGGPLWSSISGLRRFGQEAQTAAGKTQAQTDAVNRLAAGYAALANARIPAIRATASAVAATWNSGYVTQMNQANEATKRQAEAQARLAASITGGGGGGGGGSAPATKELTKAQKRMMEQYEKTNGQIEKQADRLSKANDELAAAQDRFDAYANSYTEWLTSTLSLSDAVRTAADTAGTDAAVTWLDAFKRQMEVSRTAQDAMAKLAATLDASNIAGNQALIAQLMTLPPGQAATIANEIVNQGIGPALAADLAAYNVWAGQAGIEWSSQFSDAGVDAATAQYEAIKTTLESKMEDLYQLGKKMGKKVADGYKDAVAGLPSNVQRAGATQTTTYAAPTYNVTVNGAIDPVGTSRQIRRILTTGDLRSGRGV